MTANEQASRLRQQIGQHIERLHRLAEVAVGRSGLLAGSLYQRRKKCGKARCQCVRGKLHQDIVLVVRQNGRPHYPTIAGLNMGEIGKWVNGWRQFRRARREMIGIFKGILATVDGLGKLRQIQIKRSGRIAQRG